MSHSPCLYINEATRFIRTLDCKVYGQVLVLVVLSDNSQNGQAVGE